MPEYALAAAGVFVFALTTWASLVIGYEVFQHIWEVDQADGAAPAPLPSDNDAAPVVAADAIVGEAPVPGELVRPADPTA